MMEDALIFVSGVLTCFLIMSGLMIVAIKRGTAEFKKAIRVHKKVDRMFEENDMMTINTQDRRERVEEMSEEDRIRDLDPICAALEGTLSHHPVRYRPDRVAALAVLEVVEGWHVEKMSGAYEPEK